jgi:hypothetical protein
MALPLQFGSPEGPTMRHPRITTSLFLVLGLLALLVTPLTATAGSGPTKKAPAAASKAAAKKKVDPARSAAAKKGWETRRINQKAEANWASRVAKNPKADKPGAREAFLKRSVASQKSWQKRKAASASAPSKAAKKVKSGKSGKGKKVAAASKSNSKSKSKSKKKSSGKKVAAAKKTAKGAPDDGPSGSIVNSGAGAAELKNALAKFEEAQFADGEGRAEDAAIAQMEGHDLMATAAFAAADAYEEAGNEAEAAKLNKFGEDHLAAGDQLEQRLQGDDQANQAEQQALAARAEKRPGAVRRFFSRLNPANWGKGGNRQADNGQFQFE